ncbi:LysR family transcriptional regulator [Streptomyces sp. Da 82-17]|uniref:LysR family transcriptional regulator n=1 Tax=Streptomyces sp. Da 82-17 TaxID=3377116 RepID=UPI0038D4D84C
MSNSHKVGSVDLVGACRAFIAVSECGSFTVGAAAARLSQPVASRRVAALEEHFGERLFERTARRALLTPFGRDMLPAARRLVQAADVLQHEAEAARRKPWRLAVPGVCPAVNLARLVAEARGHGVTLDLRVAGPAERSDLLHAQQVRAALLAVPERDATWSVPLGLAASQPPGVRRVYLETLRVGRTTFGAARGSTGSARTASGAAGTAPGSARAVSGVARRVWVQPEDDVPHIRDPLTRLRDAVGLRPAQLAVGADLPTAAAEVLCSQDLLLCSPAQADELGLYWRPLGEARLVRGFALTAAADDSPQHVQDQLGEAIARCLGADHPTHHDEAA